MTPGMVENVKALGRLAWSAAVGCIMGWICIYLIGCILGW